MNPQTIKELLDFSQQEQDTPVITSQRWVFSVLKRLVSQGKKGFYIIKGLRGSGKTTILKNLLRMTDGLFSSGDFLRLKGYSLEDVFKTADYTGKKWVFIDEVHYLDDWKLQLKVMVDRWKNMGIVVTGSSSLLLEKSGDLLRRGRVFELNTLSFREFLSIKGVNVEIKESLFDKLTGRDNLEKVYYSLVPLWVKYSKVIRYFNEYINNPLPVLFEIDHPLLKQERLRHVINAVIEEDIPKLYPQIEVRTLLTVKDILYYISTNEKTSINTISNHTGISKSTVSLLLELLEKSSLITSVSPKSKHVLKGMKKICFHAPLFRRAVGYHIQPTGFEREDQFVKVVRSTHAPITYEYNQKYGYDFLVEKRKFEIGGPSKHRRRGVIYIEEKGDLEYHSGALTIPLELFSLFERAY